MPVQSVRGTPSAKDRFFDSRNAEATVDSYEINCQHQPFPAYIVLKNTTVLGELLLVPNLNRRPSSRPQSGLHPRQVGCGLHQRLGERLSRAGSKPQESSAPQIISPRPSPPPGHRAGGPRLEQRSLDWISKYVDVRGAPQAPAARSQPHLSGCKDGAHASTESDRFPRLLGTRWSCGNRIRHRSARQAQGGSERVITLRSHAASRPR
jgi:hypothetical protein